MHFDPTQLKEPLDLEAHIAGVPVDANVRGVALLKLTDYLAEHEATPPEALAGPYRGFSRYPTHTLLRLLAHTAQTLHPELGLREALYEMGLRTYEEAKRASLFGRTVLGSLERKPGSILKVAHMIYGQLHNQTRVRCLRVDERRCLVRCERLYTFLDAFQLGNVVGMVRACGHEPRVALRKSTRYDGELDIEW